MEQNSTHHSAVGLYATHINRHGIADFYDSDVCRMLHDKDLGLHLMSDTYIVNNLIEELRAKQ